MSKVGRKDKYLTHIRPRFQDIEKWLNEGAEQKKIAEKLGIAYSTWNTYKARYPELKKLVDKPREGLIEDLRSALVKRALGYRYRTTKTYIKENPDGSVTSYTETVENELPPDTTAIFGALNLYDNDYVKDKKNFELKKEELELKRQQLLEKNEW